MIGRAVRQGMDRALQLHLFMSHLLIAILGANGPFPDTPPRQAEPTHTYVIILVVRSFLKSLPGRRKFDFIVNTTGGGGFAFYESNTWFIAMLA